MNMKRLVVACAQQQMRLFDAMDSYYKELDRFLHMARAKGAELAVFPALEGVLAASSLVEGFRMNLLKQADGSRRGGSLWRRTRGALASGTASLLKANFASSYADLLSRDPQSVRSAYETAFGDLATTYGLTIVAGSAYLPDDSGVVRHMATVFGPGGEILGRHNKVILAGDESVLCQPGSDFTVVDTPSGRLGILIGQEALYPESGRILAYRGAEVLITLAATANEGLASHLRHASISRAQENQLFAMASFLVGKNHLAPSDDSGAVFLGRSGIYAPLELTQRYTGVLVEIGTSVSEGLLTAELQRPALRELWQSAAEPVRDRPPVPPFVATLPGIYTSGCSLSEVWAEGWESPLALPGSALPPEAGAEVLAGQEAEAPEVGTLLEEPGEVESAATLPGGESSVAEEPELQVGQESWDEELSGGVVAAAPEDERQHPAADLPSEVDQASSAEPVVFTTDWTDEMDAAPGTFPPALPDENMFETGARWADSEDGYDGVDAEDDRTGSPEFVEDGSETDVSAEKPSAADDTDPESS
jgi:predicted amidohydrolase